MPLHHLSVNALHMGCAIQSQNIVFQLTVKQNRLLNFRHFNPKKQLNIVSLNFWDFKRFWEKGYFVFCRLYVILIHAIVHSEVSLKTDKLKKKICFRSR